MENFKSLYIISNTANEREIPKIQEKYPDKQVFILKTVEFACSLKYKEDCFYLLLTTECMNHRFKNRIFMHSEDIMCCERADEKELCIEIHENRECYNANLLIKMFNFLETYELLENNHECNKEFFDKYEEFLIGSISADSFSKISLDSIIDKFAKKNITNEIFEEKSKKNSILEKLKDLALKFVAENTFSINYRSENFYKFFFRFLVKSKEIRNLDFNCEDSRVKYLIKRLNFTEKIKFKTNFGIFVTSSFFLNKALILKKYLESYNKNVYLHFLKDVTYQRLKCFDGIECIIIYDCEFNPNTIEKDLNLPYVYPFEVKMAFEEWRGEYLINTIFFKKQADENFDQRILLRGESIGQIIKRNEPAAVSFTVNDEDIRIEEGLSGIASSYESEQSK